MSAIPFVERLTKSLTTVQSVVWNISINSDKNTNCPFLLIPYFQQQQMKRKETCHVHFSSGDVFYVMTSSGYTKHVRHTDRLLHNDKLQIHKTCQTIRQNAICLFFKVKWSNARQILHCNCPSRLCFFCIAYEKLFFCKCRKSMKKGR